MTPATDTNELGRCHTQVDLGSHSVPRDVPQWTHWLSFASGRGELVPREAYHHFLAILRVPPVRAARGHPQATADVAPGRLTRQP
jgi:hypothetical protein